MKKLLTATVLLMAFGLIFSSCNKNDDGVPNTGIIDEISGTYQVFKDGTLLDEGSVPLVGIIQDNDENWTNNVSTTENDFTLVILQFPRSVGDEQAIDSDNDPGVSVMFSGEIYLSNAGTIKRESATRISFDGTFSDGNLNGSYNLTGYLESDVIKKVE